MAEETSLSNDRDQFQWFEETIGIRGLKLSLDQVKDVYRELSAINKRFGKQLVSALTKLDEETDEELLIRKDFLQDNAFRLTVTIQSQGDHRVYGENIEVFNSPHLPMPIDSIYFTNATAFRRNSGGSDPENRIVVLLDFTKPALLDPNPLVSDPTPNTSHVSIKSAEVTFHRAVQQVVKSKMILHRTWYGTIHRKFVYDVGFWLVALPVALILSTYYMEKWLPQSSEYAAYRWAFFAYSVGLALIVYRFVFSYSKWAFPVNILTNNKDNALRHRIALGGLLAWIAYKLRDALVSIIF